MCREVRGERGARGKGQGSSEAGRGEAASKCRAQTATFTLSLSLLPRVPLGHTAAKIFMRHDLVKLILQVVLFKAFCIKTHPFGQCTVALSLQRTETFFTGRSFARPSPYFNAQMWMGCLPNGAGAGAPEIGSRLVKSASLAVRRVRRGVGRRGKSAERGGGGGVIT